MKNKDTYDIIGVIKECKINCSVYLIYLSSQACMKKPKQPKKESAREVRWPGQKLTSKELQKIVESDESLASYLSSLLPHQVEDLKDVIIGSRMPAEVKNTLLRLMDVVYMQSREVERGYKKKILPLATGVCTAMALSDQIAELEQLQNSLS